MNSNRWARLDELLERALELPPDKRASWMEHACAEDESLRTELEVLLAHAVREDDSLRPSAFPRDVLGTLLAEDVQSDPHLDSEEDAGAIRPGTPLGTYRIVERIGGGGMGEVFAAEDTKLRRLVALKVLPPTLANRERRQRFEREARAIAALNHPNIVHLYSVEEFDGVAFLTMELVNGKTLGERIPNGGLPLKELLSFGVGLTDALAAAHGEGVIHRDLKPGNVMLTEDDRLKVLDFGLAKVFEPGWTGSQKGGKHDSDPDGTEELTNLSATEEGHIIGTVSHMSPEQAEGKAVDHRTDIFSLGIVLYEMAVSRLPFRGDSAAAMVSAILKDTPTPLTELRPAIPPAFARVVEKCLAKDPTRRYQNAEEVRQALQQVTRELDSIQMFRPMEPSASGLGVLGGVTATAAVIALALVYLSLPSDTTLIDPLSGSFSQITSEGGPELFPTLSPGGDFLAYASQTSGDWDIYLRRTSGRRPINITEDSEDDETQPAFSPDGEYIAFHSSRQGGGIFVMGATGESVRKLTDFGWNAAWSPDGAELVFATEGISRMPQDRPTKSALWKVRLEDGQTELLYEGDAVQPSWSPNGQRVAFWALAPGTARRDIYTIPSSRTAGGEDEPTPIAVTEDDALDWNPVWSPDGRYLYYSSDRGGSMNLWRIPVDETLGTSEGPPEPVRAPSTFASHVHFSRDGRRMVYTSTVVSLTLESVPFDPVTGTAGRFEMSERRMRHVASPAISPDGEWVAISREGIQEDIVLLPLLGDVEVRQLTDDEHRDRSPRWSPDGERIAFYSNRGGTYEVWSVRSDGSDLTQHTDLPEMPTRYPLWSPDGSRILFSGPGVTGVMFDPDVAWSEQEPERLPQYPREGEEFIPLDWSPDGKWLSGYILSEGGVRAGIGVYSFETGEYETLTSFGVWPQWFSDSRRILFQGLGPERAARQSNYERRFKTFVVDHETREFYEVFAMPGASVETPTLSPDDKTLYFVLSSVEADVWMLDSSESASEN